MSQVSRRGFLRGLSVAGMAVAAAKVLPGVAQTERAAPSHIGWKEFLTRAMRGRPTPRETRLLEHGGGGFLVPEEYRASLEVARRRGMIRMRPRHIPLPERRERP